MAVGRELILTIRAQNYASATLRRVGRDLANLSRQEDIAVRRRQIQQSNERLKSAMQLNKAQLQSIEYGKRAIEQQKAVLAQQKAESRVITQRLSLLAKQDALNKAGLSTGHPRQVNISRQLRENAIQEVIVAQNGLKVVASQDAMDASAARLSQRLAIDAEQLQLNALRMNELALAEKRVPFERLQTYSQTLSHLGRAAQLAGVITVAAFGLMGKAAADFQTQSTLAATQAQTPLVTVQQQSGFIQKSTLDLMRQFPATSEEVTKSFYDIFSSMDVGRGKALALEKSFNRLSVAGMAPLEDVTNAGITIMNNFAGALRNPEQAMNQILATVRFGRLTLQQYTGTLTQLVPAFKNAFGGGADSLLQMNAALSETTRLLPSQRASGVGLARLVEMFQKPGFAEGLKKFGVNITDAQGRLLPFATIMDRISRSTNPFVHGLHDRTTSTVEFFKALTNNQGTVQGRRVFNALISDTGNLDKRLGQLKNDTGELNRSFNNLRQSPGVQWAVVVNTFKAVAIEIGYGVVPAVQKLLKEAKPLTDWFQNLSPETKRTIGELGLLTGVFLAVGGALAVIIGAFGSAYAAIRLFLLGQGGLAALEGGFVSTATALRVGFLGALILALPLIIKYHQQIGTAVTKLGGLKTVLEEIGIVIGLIKLRALIGSIALVGTTAGVAATEVSGLRGMLLGLSGMSLAPIVIPIALASLIPHSKGGQETLNKLGLGFLGTLPFVGGGYQQAGALGNRLRMATGGDDLSQPAVKVLSQVQSLQQKIDALEIPPHAKGWRKKIADYKAMIKTIENGAAVVGKSGNVLKTVPFDSGTFSGTTPFPTTVNPKNPGFDLNSAIKNAVKLDKLAQRTNTVANYKKAAAALKRIQDNTDADTFAAAQQVISSLESADAKHTKKAVSEAKKRAKQLAAERKKAKEAAQQDIQQIAQTLSSTYDNLRQQNQTAMGTLFQGPFVSGARFQNRAAYGVKPTGRDLLTDLRAMVSRFHQWRRALGQLQKRGVPFEMYQQILQMGPDALPQIRALLSLDPKEFQQYTSVFKQGQKAVERASQKDMSINLRHWRSLGSNIMKAILKGMDEHTAQFEAYFKNLAISLYPGLAAKGKVKPTKGVAGALVPSHGGTGIRDYGAPSGEHSVSYNIYPKETDVSTALGKAKNHYKNTYGRGKH